MEDIKTYCNNMLYKLIFRGTIKSDFHKVTTIPNDVLNQRIEKINSLNIPGINKYDIIGITWDNVSNKSPYCKGITTGLYAINQQIYSAGAEMYVFSNEDGEIIINSSLIKDNKKKEIINNIYSIASKYNINISKVISDKEIIIGLYSNANALFSKNETKFWNEVRKIIIQYT